MISGIILIQYWVFGVKFNVPQTMLVGIHMQLQFKSIKTIVKILDIFTSGIAS